ncbi:N-acetylglucosamine repressor [Mucisphaera calidilacus]|uniref:N-acetylglucosamine repressor n=2 Tax=Mucisphaera calidilacus TaxID=2527982 RepID=A0A518BU04_9BACT|nr:N-acetylglucosamine repressor [Mucisphaera calidilacus]
MQGLKKINQASAAAMNRALVLGLIRESGPLSRRQLTEKTSLRSSSVTYITRDLIEAQIIHERGKLDSNSVGKKQVLLDINPDFGWVIGIGIDGDWMSLVMLDAQGCVIDRDHVAMLEPFELLPERLKQRIDSWIDRRGQPAGELLGIGIGMPGVIDPDRGIALRSVPFRLTSWPLAERFNQRFNVPVTVDNDSNFAALAEARQGHGKDAGDFLYFLINAKEDGDRYTLQGLGSSLFLNGQLYRGAHFAAGEIDKLIQNGEIESLSAKQILALGSPDGQLDSGLKRALNQLGLILVATTDLLDLPAVLLGGNINITNPTAIEYLQERINREIVPVPDRHVTVYPSRLIEQGVSTGAAIAATEAAFRQSSQVMPVVKN